MKNAETYVPPSVNVARKLANLEQRVKELEEFVKQLQASSPTRKPRTSRAKASE